MFRSTMILLATTTCCHAAFADEMAAADDSTIVVLAPKYAEGRITSATKTDTPLRDVPQAISVVTRDLINDQTMRSIADVVRYTPGVSSGLGEGHRDQLTIRGQNTTADFFVDGVRDDAQYFRSLYNVERVEVLKGPSAMIFGRGGGGGVINRVTKMPVFDASFGAFIGSIDTFGSAFVEADVNTPVSQPLAVRLNAFYERLDNHRDAFDGDRFAINPTIKWAAADTTDLVLSYEYVDDERVVDRGVPSKAGRPVRGFRHAFFGVEGVNQSELGANTLKLTTHHRFSEALQISNKLSYADYDKLYRNAFTATAVRADGTVGIEAYQDETKRENLFSQTDVVWHVATGPVEHVVLLGNEVGTQDSRNRRINGFFDSGVPTVLDGRRTFVPFNDPVAIPPITFRAGTGQRTTRSDADVLAFYAQDQLSFGEHFDIIAGIRYDRFKLSVTDEISGQTFSRTDELWSPRAGIVYKPVEAASIYASYSRSYLPQSGDQFSSLDVTTAALKPERFDNYEVGIKWDVSEDLNVTAAVYQLDRSNTRAVGPVPGTVVLTGEQRSKGLEVGFNGQLMPSWRVSAGYTLQDAEIRRTTSAAPAGRDVAQVPKHLASLWNHYDVTDNFGVGLGIYHQSRSFAAISNAVTLPAYTRVDAALFYVINDRFKVQANVENLLGERYFPTAHNDNNIATGAPTSVRLTLHTRL